MSRKIKHLLLGVWMLLAVMLPTYGWADANNANRVLRVAVVDFTKLLQGSPQYKAADDNLKASFLGREAALEEELKAIQRLEEQVVHIVDADQLLDHKRALRDRKRKHSRELEDFREEVRVARDAAIAALQTEIREAIANVREQEQIDLVLGENDYIVASDRIDMTPKVMHYLEQRFQQQQAAEMQPQE